MPGRLHYFYDQLTENERDFVDSAMREVFRLRHESWPEVPLDNRDAAEVATDALSRWVLVSRYAAHAEARQRIDAAQEIG